MPNDAIHRMTDLVVLAIGLGLVILLLAKAC